MARRIDTTLTLRAVATATKWVRPRTIVRKVADISDRKALPTMAHVAIVKRPADVGGKMARLQELAHVAMRRKAHDTCAARDRPAVTVRHEMATKARAIDAQTARRAATDHLRAMAPAVNIVPILTIRRARPTESQIRKKATTSPKLLFNPLSLAPGPASLGPSQHGTGLLHSSRRLGPIVPINRPLRADSHLAVEVPGLIPEFRRVPATFVAARNCPIYTEIRHFRAQSPPAADSAGLIHASIGHGSPRDRPTFRT